MRLKLAEERLADDLLKSYLLQKIENGSENDKERVRIIQIATERLQLDPQSPIIALCQHLRVKHLAAQGTFEGRERGIEIVHQLSKSNPLIASRSRKELDPQIASQALESLDFSLALQIADDPLRKKTLIEIAINHIKKGNVGLACEQITQHKLFSMDLINVLIEINEYDWAINILSTLQQPSVRSIRLRDTLLAIIARGDREKAHLLMQHLPDNWIFGAHKKTLEERLSQDALPREQ